MTNIQIVKEVIDQGPLLWFTPHEIQREILSRHGKLISDAGITARLRDLRKARYGRHKVESRRRECRGSFEYQLVSTAQQEA